MTTYDVFLSHASDDKPEVEALARRLREDGLEPFLDKWHLVPGEPWQEGLEQALGTSRTCAVFVGEKLGPWQNEEMRDALAERVRSEGFRVIPVLLPGALMPGAEDLPRFLRRLTWVDFRGVDFPGGLDDGDAYHRLVCGIRGVPPEAGTEASTTLPFHEPGETESTSPSGSRTGEPDSGRKRDMAPTLTALAALVAALAALVTSIVQVSKEIEGELNRYPLFAFGLLGFLAVYVLAWLVRRWLAPPSTFQRSSALDIGRKYLRGRDTDLDNLLNRLKNFPLVWLVGESGAGKSALLVLGLVPRLEEERSFFPVYLEHWGADWERGPPEGLCRALNEKLDGPARMELGLNGPVTVDQLMPVLGCMQQKLGRTPVLIFDQFDDYQTRHRVRFLRGDERKVIASSMLRAENTFWNDVAELFEEGRARCLFVTRTDMGWGLECVRFGEPEPYVLDRLGRTYAAELLDEITAGDVVVAPERGWEGLKKRLLEDLGKDGWVLPIRMKFAFRGLRELRALSVGHYEREGGLEGLEALDVKRHVVQAARLASLAEDDVRRLLLELIEPESQSKTVPRTNARLLATLSESGRVGGQLVRALRTLQDADILRQGIDPDQEGEAVWLLYHDYLCRGVVELDRRARHWQILLEDAMRVFEGARGVVGRWRALLRPALQLRFGYAWLRGQLRFGTAGRFAAVSTVRLIANVWILGLVFGFFGWNYFGALAAQQRAQDLFAYFTLEETTTEEEADALWWLSRERMGVRKAFYETAFSTKPNVERFLTKSNYILQATLGLNDEYHRRLLGEIIEDNCDKELAYEYSVACLNLSEAFPHTHEWTEVSGALANQVGDSIARIEDGMQLDALARGLGALGDHLPSQVAGNAFIRIFEVMAQSQDAGQLNVLTRGLRTLGDHLPAQVAEAAAGRILEVMARTQDGGQLSTLARGLGALGDQLPAQVAEAAAGQILEVMAQTQDNGQLGVLARGLGALGDKLSPQVAEDTANRIFEIMAQTQYQGPLEALAGGLEAIGGNLDQKAAEGTADRIVEVMTQTQDLEVLGALARGLGALGDKCPPQTAENASNRIVQHVFRRYQISHRPWPFLNEINLMFFDEVWQLSSSLGALGDKLLPQAAEDAADRIVWAITRHQDPARLDALVMILGAFSVKLPPEAAGHAAHRIVKVMAQTQDSWQISTLAGGLRALGDKLPSKAAEAAADRIVELMAQTQDSRQMSTLARGLGALGDKLPSKAAEAAADRIVKLMAQIQDSRQLSLLVSGLGALGDKLPMVAAENAADQIVKAIAKSQDLSALFSDLGDLGKKLRANKAKSSLRLLLGYLRTLKGPRCLLAKPFIQENRENLQLIVELLKWPTCSAKDRAELIQQIGQVTGQPFDSEWAFIQWAKAEGYQPGRPPRDPEPLESVLKELTGQ